MDSTVIFGSKNTFWNMGLIPIIFCIIKSQILDSEICVK